MTKQTATFREFAGISEHPRTGEINATLLGVRGHPRLGYGDVIYTSRLERLGYDASGAVNEVETRNTIYRRAE